MVTRAAEDPPVAPAPEVGGRRGRHRAPRHPSPPAPAGTEAAGTRERILDVALDLFIERGFDKTSLREIATQLGVTKAALYYHFPSKDDILMTLHLRMHDVIRSSLSKLAGQPTGRASWMTFLDGLVDQVAANDRLFLMHQRNAAAFAEVHRKDHGGSEVEPDQLLRGMLGDSSLSLDDRVRIAGSLAVVLAGATMLVDPAAQQAEQLALADILRAAVRDLLLPGSSAGED